MTTNHLVTEQDRQHAILATELNARGYEVTIACMDRFGLLVAEIPASIRVVRQPWWAPAVDVNADRSVMITGDTKAETRFGAIWRASGRDRRWLVAGHGPRNLAARRLAWDGGGYAPFRWIHCGVTFTLA